MAKKGRQKAQIKIARGIKRPDERELWGRAGGRCEFSDCNKVLYKSPVTSERVNLAEMAHVWAFSEDGPRGRGDFAEDTTGLNAVDNLLLVCHDCHLKIDRNKEQYPASLLKQWKREHETRIRITTGISPEKKSHVVLYGARIGEEQSPLNWQRSFNAMFPDWYPSDDRAVNLSMQSGLDDNMPAYWTAQEAHLRMDFDRQIRVRIEEARPNHFSIFGLAPQPLLILLGSLFTDKVPAIVYQLHREPSTWKWQPHPDDFQFTVKEPASKEGIPVLVLSLSAKIAEERITSVMSEAVSMWEISIENPYNDFLRSEAQTSMFREIVRRTIARISESHPGRQPLHVFPAMPVACAVDFGRTRMPKADRAWVIYDQNNKQGKFIKTITIGTTT